MDFAGGSHDSRHLQDLHNTPLYPSTTSSTAAAYGVLFLIFIYYVLQYLDYTNLSLPDLLWNSLVYITPLRIVSALGSGFGTAMADDTQDENTGFNSKGHASKSNAMRRILGLDSARIMTTIQRTRTISNVGSVFKARPSNSLPGLGNWDNSCYQNSVLQGLAALKSLPAFLGQTTVEVPGPTKKALNETIARLNDPANVGKTFWTPAELKSMSSWQQQDAQEYFSKISDELEKDTAKATKKRPGSGGLETLLSAERSITRTSSPETITSSRASSEDDTTHVGELPDEVASLIIRNPLEGLLAQRVGCQQCGYVEGLSLVPFNCLTVPLGRQWIYDVRSCLDEYTALEPINGVECAKCTLLRAKQQMEALLSKIHPDTGEGKPARDEGTKAFRLSLRERLSMITQALEEEDFSDQVLKKCQIPSNNRVSTTKTRQAVIARNPRSLVVHVNRSNFDEFTGVQSKNSATVRFPQQLDLAPWCLGHDPSSDNKDDGLEIWNVDPSKSMLSTEDSIENFDSGRMYELRAVITHYGRHENGHYICYRRSPYSNKNDDTKNVESPTPWWRLSDEDVTEVDEDTVLAQGGVFMLFYEHVAPVVPQEKPQPVLVEQVAELQAITEEAESLQPTQVIDVSEVPILDDSQTAKLEQQDLAAVSTDPVNSVSLQASAEDTEREVLVAESLDPESGPKVDPVANMRDSSRSLSHGLPETPLSAASEAKPSPPASAPESKIVAKPASPERKEVAVELAESTTQVDTLKENQPVSPLSMRTAGPRSGRGSGSRAGKAMGSVAGCVQAN